MEKLKIDIEYYKESLVLAETEIETIHNTGKALKDVIGIAYEKHRERIWKYFGFEVSKEKNDAMFDIDWCIKYKGELIAFEEDKGHYIDSCFLERALCGFSKTVNIYIKKNKKIPLFVLHSFTKYNKYIMKLEQDIDTRKSEISDILQNKLIYTTLVNCDRLSKKKWFSKDYYKAYTDNANEELIIKDIKFIQSLIPVSE